MNPRTLQLRNRRGAILVLVGLSVVMFAVMLAVVIDISRLMVQKNELQTAADAAAHAGALQMALRDSNAVDDSAVVFGQRNAVIGHTAAFASSAVTCGVWDPTAATFTTSAHSARCGDSANAVRVNGTDSSHYFFSSVLSAGKVQVLAPAIAWVSSTVGNTSCVRPWGIAYWTLTKRLDPTNPDTTRDLTAYDLHQLAILPRSSLRFLLKVGNPLTPGNFGPLDIGGTGAAVYRTNIETCNPTPVGPGSILDTETGNMVGPTKQGVSNLCQPLYANGACGDGAGGIGLVIKAPLWVSASSVAGKTSITVKIIGSFTLDTLTNQSEIIGHFLRVEDTGSIGTTPGTLVRVILVK